MSRQSPAVTWELACTLMRKLSGFRGYPRPIDSPGEHHFIHAFQDCAISVEHAMAIVDSFDQEFPTLLHLREAASQLRSRFEPDAMKAKQWEKEYGKPDPDWSRNLTGSFKEQKGRMLWQAIRDSLFYTEGPGTKENKHVPIFWREAMDRHHKRHPDEVAAVRADIEREGWTGVMKHDWANEVRSPVAVSSANPITQSDFDALPKRDAKMLASGDDSASDDPGRWE